MHQFFGSVFFNFEFIRILSAAPFGGADIAECIVACSQIRDGDPESWHRAWYAQAEKAKALADDALRTGDRVSARRAYLRASNYFRASAYMFLDRDRHNPETRVAKSAQSLSSTFKQGISLLEGTTVLSLDIPFESSRTLPGFLYVPSQSQRLALHARGTANGDVRQPLRRTPVLIHLGGADSTKEELYYVYAASGPELGYAVLTFDGPGQGMVLRQGPGVDIGAGTLYSRPDWENVIDYVLDYLEQLAAERPELGLDLSRVAVTGASMGGYYALRAAADPRVCACVSIDPFFDMYDFAVMHVGPLFSRILGAWASGWVPTMVVNWLMGAVMALDFRTYWEVTVVQWFMGVHTPTQALLQMRRYSFRQEDGTNFLQKVKCPVLISGAGQSLYLQPGTDVRLIYDSLGHLSPEDKSVWIASNPEDGGLQAKIGAIGLCAQKTFEFLNVHFRATGSDDSMKQEYEHV